ncbi:hypothetical protein L226DRAFT_540369 [Lentinus tigrinus ALCF2SS1-7]|uniref:uncharacterized protein n=1 Tax=Lentinus tigrinus ALCF2SS1-7 TaxID=1328758 RepID=UPI001165CADC|nr:hypothetical protein L226DRAFT_540369 [Lentinus tigrinus ALCF2SS1-7]
MHATQFALLCHRVSAIAQWPTIPALLHADRPTGSSVVPLEVRPEFLSLPLPHAAADSRSRECTPQWGACEAVI